MHDEMVERVAWALRKQFTGGAIAPEVPGFGIMDDYRGEEVGDWRDMARATIEAMREPTKEMLDAVDPNRERMMGSGYTWQTMIDAALSYRSVTEAEENPIK